MTNVTTFYDNYWLELRKLLSQESPSKLGELGSMIIDCHRRGGKIIVVGNGGSAAIASHAAVDLTKAAKISAIASVKAHITCLANDFGYQEWVQKALEIYAEHSDLVVLISSSGKSENILNAAKLRKHSKKFPWSSLLRLRQQKTLFAHSGICPSGWIQKL